VVAMFGSIILLMFLPWIDGNAVKSARYRPTYKMMLLFLLISFFGLMYSGAKPPEGMPLYIGQAGTVYYFGHFIILFFLSRREKTLPVPNSISEDPCLKKGA
jgi:ubiquinol-cytochrome c reductase cytochrome b/c1 subunit